MPVANQYLVSTFEGNAKPESVEDALNNLHPAVAPAHAIWSQESIDTDKPVKLMADYPIDRSASAGTILAMPVGQDATIASPRGVPTRFFTRTQIMHDGVSAARTAQEIRLYGIDDPLDYGIDQSLVYIMDNLERAFHWGLGTEDASGASGSPAGPTPRTHGLIGWIGWTGGERRASGSGTVGDGMQAIPDKYWTSFYDAGGTGITLAMYYDQILGPAWRLGHQTDGSIQLMSDRLMNAVARFNDIAGPSQINRREIPARDQHLEDIVTAIRTPNNGTVYMVPDRIMSIEGVATTLNNTVGGFVGGTGTLNVAVPWNETLFSVMPSYFDIAVLHPIDWKDLPSSGDYAVGMTVTEKAFRCAHLFAGCGAFNLLP